MLVCLKDKCKTSYNLMYKFHYAKRISSVTVTVLASNAVNR